MATLLTSFVRCSAHFCRTLKLGCLLEGSRPEGFRIASRGRSENGEKLAGPALNPLKGSSANSSHASELCKFCAIAKSFSYSTSASQSFVKMRQPRENLRVR